MKKECKVCKEKGDIYYRLGSFFGDLTLEHPKDTNLFIEAMLKAGEIISKTELRKKKNLNPSKKK